MVFGEEIRNVGGGADGNEIEQFMHLLLSLVRTEERLCKLEGDPYPTKIALAVGAIRSPGINHCIGLGELFRRGVVVGNDDIDAERFWICHFFEIGTAAVGRDNQRCTPGFKLVQRLPSYPPCLGSLCWV